MDAALEELKQLDLLRMETVRRALREDPAAASIYLGLKNPAISQALKTLGPAQVVALVKAAGPTSIFRIEDSPTFLALLQRVIAGAETGTIDAISFALSKGETKGEMA